MVALTFGLYSFYSFPLCYLVFVDWTRVVSYVRSRWSGAGRPVRISESSPTPT
jgi:hypothetical protein